jgi:hypothetical protein
MPKLDHLSDQELSDRYARADLRVRQMSEHSRLMDELDGSRVGPEAWGQLMTSFRPVWSLVGKRGREGVLLTLFSPSTQPQTERRKLKWQATRKVADWVRAWSAKLE